MGGGFHAYLRKTIVNLARSHYRRRAVERRFLERQTEAPSADPDDLSDRERLRGALMALPIGQRTAIVLRYFEDLSEAQTADLMGRHPGAVKSLVSRGMGDPTNDRWSGRMNETQFRHRLFDLAEDAPSGSSAPPALLRRARRRVVLTIASSVAIAVLVVGMGIAGVRALQSAPTPADTPVQDPRARLDALGERWMTSVATITYRTTERDPGEPASPHQCLRQIVGGDVDRQTALRICSGLGELRLAWDPPDRWRMDAASPDGIFALLSTPEGRLRCHGSDMVAKTCVATESSGPFGSLVDPPALALDEIGAPVTVEAGRTIAGMRSECFAVEGGPADAIHRAEWCYSGDGLLLFVLDQVEGGRVTIEEATDVSPGVSDRDFIVPST